MSNGPSWSPDEVDLSQPSVARVYDFYLGGSHNFESDREFGRQAVAQFPGLPKALRDNRDFLRRAVRYFQGQGIDQFLDLGSGIPTVGNVHEVAQAADPQARIVYVDHDPVAVAHSNELLRDNPLATALADDIRDPRRVLDDAVATGLLDPSRPVGVLMVAVLHFVQDEDRPAELIAEYMRELATGTHLAVSHARSDGDQQLLDSARVYDRDRSPGRMRLRTRAEVEALFGGLTMVEPGVTVLPLWRPEPTDDGEAPVVDERFSGLAGVGRKD